MVVFQISPRVILVLLFFVCCHSSSASQLDGEEGSIIYVDSWVPETSAQSGISWANAFRDLQSAISVASSGDCVYVAEGIYFPDRGSGQTLGDRNSTFSLTSGVRFFGGFPRGGSSFEMRSSQTFQTTLSGAIGSSFISDNCYHVISGLSSDSLTSLDGFIVSHGNANGQSSSTNSGGGLSLNSTGSLEIVECVFERHRSAEDGGAIPVRGEASVNCINTIFRYNSARVGGAVSHSSNYAMSSTYSDCRFFSNTAEFGGALQTQYSQTILRNAVFLGNRADYGGAVYCFDFRSANDPTFINCSFAGNRADWGGAMNTWSASPVIKNCTFAGNSARGGGGAIMVTNGWGPFSDNTIIWGNSADGSTDTSSASVLLFGDSEFFASNCLLANSGGSRNWNPDFFSDRGGNIDQDPLFISPVDSSWGVSAETDLALNTGSPVIDRGKISLLPSGTTTDQRGAPRIIGEGLDLGAFETTPELIASNQSAQYSPPFWVKIPVTELRASVSGGLDLNPLEIRNVSISENWENWASISGGYLVYVPAKNQTGIERLTYDVTDGFRTITLELVILPDIKTSNSALSIMGIVVTESEATITAAGIPGVSYQLECSEDLSSWNPIGLPLLCPAGGILLLAHSGPLPPRCHYRVAHHKSLGN